MSDYPVRKLRLSYTYSSNTYALYYELDSELIWFGCQKLLPYAIPPDTEIILLMHKKGNGFGWKIILTTSPLNNGIKNPYICFNGVQLYWTCILCIL